MVAIALFEVHAKAALHGTPGVIVHSVKVVLRAALESQGVHPVVEGAAVAAAKTRIKESLIEVASTHANKLAVRVLAGLGDDINHTVDGVWTPNRTARSTDDLDAINILQEHVLNFPVGARQQGCVDRPAINQYQNVAGEPAPKPSNADRPFVTAEASYFHAGSKP